MRELQTRCVWAVIDSNRKNYFVGEDKPVSTDSSLLTFNAAASLMCRLHERTGSPYPPPFAIALSLDASECVSVALLNAWDDDRAEIIEGAARWVCTLGSYTEKCFRGADGVSLRVIVRGRLPEELRPPPSVKVQGSGFVTLTTDRISSRPSWMKDEGGTVKDATSALAALLVPKRPQYFTM